jgi:hypothetical protein
VSFIDSLINTTQHNFSGSETQREKIQKRKQQKTQSFQQVFTVSTLHLITNQPTTQPSSKKGVQLQQNRHFDR